MNEHEFLMDFQRILKEEEFDCTLVEGTDAVPYERLLVFIGLDEKERERILEITALKQELMHGLNPSESQEHNMFRVQYQVVFPFDIHPNATSQVSSLVCYLNRMIDLPGFDMNEIDLKLSYRHVFLYGERKFNQKLFLSIVGLTMLLIELFASTLEKVSLGEKTFNQILEEILRIADTIKQKQ
jgi:hypothetical protein